MILAGPFTKFTKNDPQYRIERQRTLMQLNQTQHLELQIVDHSTTHFDFLDSGDFIIHESTIVLSE